MKFEITQLQIHFFISSSGSVHIWLDLVQQSIKKYVCWRLCNDFPDARGTQIYEIS